MDRTVRQGLTAMVAIALIWGVNFSVIKAALEEVPPLGFNALRFPLAALTLALLLRWRGIRVRPRREDVPRILFLGLVGNVAYQVLFIVGIDRTLAGNSSVLLATVPLWTAVLSARVGHERLSPRLLLAAIGTLTGVVLVVRGGPGGALGTDTLFGDLLTLGAAAVWAGYTVGGRSLVRRYGSLPVTAWTLWAGTVGLVLMGLPALSATDLGAVSTGAWIGIGYAGILAIGVAYLLWYVAVGTLGSSRTALYGNGVPVVALAAAWIWLGERPGPAQLAGVALILTALIWYGSRLRTSGSIPAPPGQE